MKKRKGWEQRIQHQDTRFRDVLILRSHHIVIKENFHFQNFMKEMDIMKKLHHPNLVKMYGICVDKLPFYIILVIIRFLLEITYLFLDLHKNNDDKASPLCLRSKEHSDNFFVNKRSIAKKETWKNIWRALSREQGSWSEVSKVLRFWLLLVSQFKARFYTSWALSACSITFSKVEKKVFSSRTFEASTSC